MNYSNSQRAGWGNFVSDRINIWRLRYFRLILEGEDRIAENGRKKEAKRIEGSYSQLEEEDHCVDMADPNADFVARLLEEEYIDELMCILSVQQRAAIYE